MSYKALLGIVPAIQSASLLNENVKVLKKKKQSVKDITGLGVKNIVGTSLIKVNANLIGGL